MRLFLLGLFLILPYFSFSQGFQIKIGQIELPVDKIPEHVVLPQRLNSLFIKKVAPDPVPKTYIVQIGEEEHSFKTNGAYHEVKFSHDIKGLVIYILDEKRNVQGKPFILRKAQ